MMGESMFDVMLIIAVILWLLLYVMFVRICYLTLMGRNCLLNFIMMANWPASRDRLVDKMNQLWHHTCHVLSFSFFILISKMTYYIIFYAGMIWIWYDCCVSALIFMLLCWQGKNTILLALLPRSQTKLFLFPLL